MHRGLWHALTTIFLWLSLGSYFTSWLDEITNEWCVYGKSPTSPDSLDHRQRAGGLDYTYTVCERSADSFEKINILDALIKASHGA